MEQVARRRPRCELADVFRAFGEEYRRSRRLPVSHLKVMRAVENCRTAFLGGHLERCDACGFERPAYNSCRNRHCPKCQAFAKGKWVEARKEELLPVPYFHNVFTIPHDLNPLILANKKVLLSLLFRAVAETLQAFGADSKNGPGGKIGFISVLHTWEQRLLDHFHIHCLIPAGALAHDRSRWIPARRKFLFPVRALSRVFRGKFIAGLRKARNLGELQYLGRASPFENRRGFGSLIRKLWKQEWVVYSRPPFQGPERTLEYLARYTHRVAISNDRILGMKDDTVIFRWRDRRSGDRSKIMTLPAREFIRRFLLHVIPSGFVRIRQYGILSNRGKKKDLPRCRELLRMDPPSPDKPDVPKARLILELTGVDVLKCPECAVGSLERVGTIPKQPFPTPLPFTREAQPEDSS